MVSELKLQTDIKTSVIRDGGYSVKLSNRFSIGIPDLLICLPPFAPCFAEVKDLGEVTDNFNRKLDVTPKQADVMRRMSEPYERDALRVPHKPRTAFVLVGFVHRGVPTLVAMRRDAERLSYSYDALFPNIERGKSRHWPMKFLLDSIGIAKVAQ